MRFTFALTVAAAIFVVPAAASAQLQTCDTFPFAACGGEVEGEWDYTGVMCFDPPDPAAMFPGCNDVRMGTNAAVSGSIEFDDDGTYEDESTTMVIMSMMVPTNCLTMNGMTCEGLALIDPSLQGVTVGDECSVTMTVNDADEEEGTWTQAGATVTTVDEDDGDVDTGTVCVQGDTMMVSIVDPDTGMRTIIAHTRAD